MKYSTLSLLLSIASTTAAVEKPKYGLSWVRDIELPTPGFLEIIDEELYLTSFNAKPYFLSKNGVYRMKASEYADAEPELLTDELDWPNDMTVLDKSMFGFNALAVGHGFLVPGHATGGVSIINLDVPSGKPVEISADLDNWFYHKAYPRDMDGDGDLDIVTARCRDNVIPFPWNPPNGGELVWLENPGGDNPLADRWEEHEIMEGPDFLINMKNGGVTEKPFELLAPQFLTELINYVYYDDNGVVQNRTLDDQLGNAFAAEFLDINGDGELDILATNHLADNGGVFAYTWDNSEDLATAKVEKHTLASGINNVQEKGMAPGHSNVVYPRSDDKSEKPYILVDGDGAENYILLSPSDGGDFESWEYDMTVLFPTECTVGKSVSGDVDGDGWSEVFIPLYEKNIVRVMRFQPWDDCVEGPPLVSETLGGAEGETCYYDVDNGYGSFEWHNSGESCNTDADCIDSDFEGECSANYPEVEEVCSGSEDSLESCTKEIPQSSNSHFWDIGITCNFLQDSVKCETCPSGTYSDTVDTSPCLECEIGKFSTKISATSEGTCQTCGEGQTTSADGSACNLNVCEQDEFNNNGKCKKCHFRQYLIEFHCALDAKSSFASLFQFYNTDNELVNSLGILFAILNIAFAMIFLIGYGTELHALKRLGTRAEATDLGEAGTSESEWLYMLQAIEVIDRIDEQGIETQVSTKRLKLMDGIPFVYTSVVVAIEDTLYADDQRWPYHSEERARVLRQKFRGYQGVLDRVNADFVRLNLEAKAEGWMVENIKEIIRAQGLDYCKKVISMASRDSLETKDSFGN
ncbi:hypothetical protein TrLO_g12384 [Triparma laevis f. longispina]|uniref:Uncharacterized protein n=1 Tax=Triparma laevis f. longispina TaxID=1714387 RepID=A0A9W7FBP7_9STRA|nr:hypothetical protein TrLO_g12384 [Triparma laevis f. longispina]